jgi:hypothetical protein
MGISYVQVWKFTVAKIAYLLLKKNGDSIKRPCHLVFCSLWGNLGLQYNYICVCIYTSVHVCVLSFLLKNVTVNKFTDILQEVSGGHMTFVSRFTPRNLFSYVLFLEKIRKTMSEVITTKHTRPNLRMWTF